MRLGSAELIPSLRLGTFYRTNVFLQEANEQSGMALQVTPGVDLSLEKHEVELDLGGEYKLAKYFKPEFSSLDRFKDGNLTADIALLPNSVVGFELNERFVSSSRESESQANISEGAVDDGAESLIRHIKNDVGGELAFHPGGALDVRAGGHFMFDDYNVPEEATYSNDPNYNSRMQYGPEAKLKWRFFPRTALLLSASMDWLRWNNHLVDIRYADVDENDALSPFPNDTYGSYLAIPDSQHLKVSGGLRGRITRRLAVHLVPGFHSAKYDEETVTAEASEDIEDGELSEDFDRDATGIEQLMISTGIDYDVRETQRFSLGYSRDLTDSYFTNFMVYNYVYTKYSVLFGGRVGLALEAGYRNEAFHGEVERTDHVVRARGDLSYGPSDWFQVGTGVWWDRRASADGQAEIEFDDLNAHLAMTFTY